MKLGDLLPAAILLGVAIIGISMLAEINQQLYDDEWNGANATAANISGEGLNSLAELGQWTPTIALVIAAALIIGILVSAFAFGRR